jgi:undecaprenyl-diphosphatase
MGETAQAVMDRITEWELPVCERFNRGTRYRWVRALFAAVSRAGDGGAWLVLALIMLAAGGTSALPALTHMAATGGICLAIYKVVKHRTVRRRPFERAEGIDLPVAPLDEYSFPSGHTMHALGFSLTACVHYPALGWVLAPFAVLIALSRVILGLHYPTDVFAGAAVGTTVALIVLQF